MRSTRPLFLLPGADSFLIKGGTLATHFLLDNIVSGFEAMDPAATTTEVRNIQLMSNFFGFRLEDRPGNWKVLLSNALKPDLETFFDFIIESYTYVLSFCMAGKTTPQMQ